MCAFPPTGPTAQIVGAPTPAANPEIGAAAGELPAGVESTLLGGTLIQREQPLRSRRSAPVAGIRRGRSGWPESPARRLRSTIAAMCAIASSRSSDRTKRRSISPSAQGATVFTLWPPRTSPTFRVMPRSRSVSACSAWILRASSSMALMPVGEVAAGMRSLAVDADGHEHAALAPGHHVAGNAPRFAVEHHAGAPRLILDDRAAFRAADLLVAGEQPDHRRRRPELARRPRAGNSSSPARLSCRPRRGRRPRRRGW